MLVRLHQQSQTTNPNIRACKSQIKQSTTCTLSCKFLYFLVIPTLLNMFRATFRPSSGALINCRRSLRFPYRSRGGRVSSRGLFVWVTNRPRLETHPPRLCNWVCIWLVVLFEIYIWRCTEPQTINPNMCNTLQSSYKIRFRFLNFKISNCF
jgi:hypothetical protein